MAGLRLWWVILAAASAGAADYTDAVLDFEEEGAWLTAPEAFRDMPPETLWSVRWDGFEALAHGVKLGSQRVKSGNRSGVWANHPRYPTVHTCRVPRDWTAWQGLSLEVYSEVATGEEVTVGVLADSDQTAWRDWYLQSFRSDWAGWRTVVLPFAGFVPLGRPAGWDQVGGIYLFTKIHDRQPNPYTVLHLDGLRLLASAPPAALVPGVAPVPDRLPVTHRAPLFDSALLNHRWPETPHDAPVTAPVQYRPYFLAERALAGYYPRFQPGFVSVDPRGRVYLRYGSTCLQWVGDDGRWTYRDLTEVIEPYARRELGLTGLRVIDNASGDDVGLRFDRDGDAYALFFVEDVGGDWKTRTGLLLHSRDGLKTWTIHRLPNYPARFEKVDDHRPGVLDRPPVILLSRYLSPTINYLLLPEKQADGSLRLPPPVKVADQAIAFTPHSGEAGQAVSHGDRVFLVYGRLEVLPGRTKEDGVPNVAVVYDRSTGKLSAPVLMGFGGRNAEDGHNWPSLAVDSRGIFHVVINGHHDPFVYVHSLRPWDLGAWSAPEKVAKATSYAGLVIDRHDTLYTVTRNSDPGYYFKLSLHRKRAGQPWEKPRDLVLPYKPYYKVYYHKLVLDPTTDRLFLCYWSQSPSICVFRDELLAYLDIWPDREESFLSDQAGPRWPVGNCLGPAPHKYEFYAPPPSEPTILVSADRGDTWHLATTSDFR